MIWEVKDKGNSIPFGNLPEAEMAVPAGEEQGDTVRTRRRRREIFGCSTSLTCKGYTGFWVKISRYQSIAACWQQGWNSGTVMEKCVQLKDLLNSPLNPNAAGERAALGQLPSKSSKAIFVGFKNIFSINCKKKNPPV